MNLIISSTLIGFGIYSIIYVLAFRLLINRNENLTLKIDMYSCLLVSFGGLLFVVKFGIDSFQSVFMTLSDYEKYANLNRMFGEYWFGYWAQPILYLVTTQLMWFRRIRNNNYARLIIGLILLIPLTEIAQIATSLNREYITNSISFSISNLLLNWVTSFGFFGTLIGGIYLINQKIKNAV